MYKFIGVFTALCFTLQKNINFFTVPGSCSAYTDEEKCLKSFPGRVCVWADGRCRDRSSARQELQAGGLIQIKENTDCVPLKGR